jgi:hypothetical protein
MAEAQGEEEDALVRAGVPTYLAFHIRRIDATIDPRARERLHLAALEHRVALKQWHELAGDLSPSDALSLEDEVRSYATAVANLGGAADEIDAVRRELTEVSEPAAEKARTALMRACAPFGVDDPAMAVGMVRHQVEMAVTARLQRELEQAEADEAAQRDELDVMLVQLGFTSGDLAARVAALEEAQGQARRRDQARGTARGREEVEAELARLEARVRQEHRPEWGTSVVPNDAEEPDVADLVRRRGVTAQAYETAARLLPDVDLLADRHRAVERRVAVLEAALEPGLTSDTRSDADEVQRQLLAQVVAARGAGPTGDPLPVLLDEPFCRLRGDKKWEILDLVERLADKTQIVYLTDDHDVVMWARRRAASGALALLEPVTEGA